MRSSVCVYENHIMCDECCTDSADLKGVSQYSCDYSGKMSFILKAVKKAGWLVDGDIALCDKCRKEINL